MRSADNFGNYLMGLTDNQFVLTYPTADKSKAQANCRIKGMEMKNALSYQRYERMFLPAGAKNRRLLRNST